MVHEIIKPLPRADAEKHQVSRQVEEKKISDSVTLRRTTIEEIEVRSGVDDDEAGD